MKLKRFSRIILIILVVIFILSLLLWSIPLGQAKTKINIQDIVKVERVKADNFGLSEPILLPGNPFYFLKNWQWAIKRFFIFNNLSKAEWSLDFLTSKVLEMRKLAEKEIVNEKRINKAIGYYELVNAKSAELLSLVDKKDILNKVAESAVFFKKAFSEIINANLSAEARSKILTLAEQKEKYFNDFFVKVNSPTEILKALIQVMSGEEDGVFSSLRNLEMMDTLVAIAPKTTKIAADFQDSLYARSISAFNNVFFVFGDSLNEIVKTLPGDKKFQRQLLWDLEERSGRSELFEKIRGNISDSFLNNEEIKQCLGDFESIQKQIADFKIFIGEGKVSINVESALISAEGGLKHAQERIAIGEEKYACNLIQSAKAKISNVSRLINLATREDIKLRIIEVEKKIFDLRGLIEKYNQEEFRRLYDLMDQANYQLLFIKSSYQIDDFESSLRKVDDFDVLVSNVNFILDIINGNDVLMKELGIKKEFFSQNNLNRFSNLCADKKGGLINEFVILPFCQLTSGEVLSME